MQLNLVEHLGRLMASQPKETGVEVGRMMYEGSRRGVGPLWVPREKPFVSLCLYSTHFMMLFCFRYLFLPLIWISLTPQTIGHVPVLLCVCVCVCFNGWYPKMQPVVVNMSSDI